jgi:hypothetical protein
MYMKPHIDLHDILQKNKGGEKLPEAVTLNVKGEEKEQNKKRNNRGMKTGGVHEDGGST